ncbi:MAG: methyltransferase domain-containing protein [Candidatus Accumulibacter sp.]|jgi:SAM-dependent methyltransferase|uniref:methyltransferase domain-containing protein n=1 Tax=Accumulibacter sp. TaxID=2053492 RepID=UPI001AC7534E|nr:methyltransferase domain-containing protein [Accumulibacter sp.]MBN8436971.1 methyltransferase domain-containing protein [Accumulibacter sp.]
MTTPVWRHILRGIKSIFVTPPLGTGGTVSAQYCYSVYLRHLVIADQHGLATDPHTIVELGPGDSIGIGLMALLTGAEQYYAIDAVRHASSATNSLIFDELTKLLTAQTPIPSGGEFAEILPKLDDYRFPTKILNEIRLSQFLATDRLSRLRMALASDLVTGPIRYLAPMGRMHDIPVNSVDLIISQAVMEHIDQLDETYTECFRCLKPGGFMSHQIDLRCHDTAPEWNGHWKYADLTWRLMRGGRPWFINRKPCSTHIGLANHAGFNIHAEIKQSVSSGISRRQLAERFKELSQSDLTTAGVLVLASKTA